MILIEEASPLDTGPRTLLQASHQLMTETFPAEDNHHLDPTALLAPHITFWAARSGPDTLGTAALADMGTYGEIKSMFVAEAARGTGVADALLRQIEDAARAACLAILMLETGDTLTAAIRLYQRHGFTRRAAFGTYPPGPSTSVFMEKRLHG